MNLAGLNWTPQPKLRIMVGDNKLKKRQKKFNDINSNLSLDLGGPNIQVSLVSTTWAELANVPD